MKICFVLNGFQENGGIGRATSVLANALSLKENISVYTISYCQTDKPMLYNVSKNIGQFSLFSRSISMTKALLFKRAIKKVKQIIEQNSIDVLVACGALYYPLCILATKGTNAKCYCWEHTNPSTESDYKFQKLCREFAIKHADKIILLTKAAKKYYIEKLRAKENKLFQIYNPIGEEVFQSDLYKIESRKIISVGRLSYPKNFECLLELARDVLPLYPDWTWDIYGEGELRQKLTDLIHAYHLQGRVTLKGQVNDLYERYQEYAFMVMTSRYEGFPMSLLEGGANRIPLVSFDIQTGPNEIIEDGESGFLIPTGDISLMKERIVQLIQDVLLRESMSMSVYKKVQTFNLENIVAQWCELFL